MTRKYEKIVAAAIKRVSIETGRKTHRIVILNLVGELCVDFYKINPRFNPISFIRACNKTERENQ